MHCSPLTDHRSLLTNHRSLLTAYCSLLTLCLCLREASADLSLSVGAPSAITRTNAILQVTVVSTGAANPAVWVYWGSTNGGTNAAAWIATNALGVIAEGLTTTNITGLTAGSSYWYTAYATNSSATNWSAARSWTMLGAYTTGVWAQAWMHGDEVTNAVDAVARATTGGTNLFAGPGTTGVVSSTAGDTNSYLRGDGTWATPAGGDDSWTNTYNTVWDSLVAGDYLLAAFAATSYAAIVHDHSYTAITNVPWWTSGEAGDGSLLTGVVAEVTAGVNSWNSRTGDVTLTAADISGAGGLTNEPLWEAVSNLYVQFSDDWTNTIAGMTASDVTNGAALGATALQTNSMATLQWTNVPTISGDNLGNGNGGGSVTVSNIVGIVDTNAAPSVDPNSRILYARDGTTPIVSWDDTDLVYGLLLSDARGLQAISFNHIARALYDTNAILSVDWQARALYGAWVATNLTISHTNVTGLGDLALSNAASLSLPMSAINNLGTLAGYNSVGEDMLDSTIVIPGTYTNTTLTVDADGRLTFAATGSAGAGGGSQTPWTNTIDAAGYSLTGGNQITLTNGTVALRLPFGGAVQWYTSDTNYVSMFAPHAGALWIVSQSNSATIITNIMQVNP